MPVKKGTVAEKKPAKNMLTNTERFERPSPPSGGDCVGKPTEWWYPVVGETDSLGRRKRWSSSLSDTTKDALKICARCPVKLRCLAYSLEWEPFGIWGGMTERQRVRLRTAMKVHPRFADERSSVRKLMAD